MWWLYVKLFYSFFKIGLFGFGGGYAMRPAVVGLLAAAALLLLTPENFSTPDNSWQFYISIFLFAFAFIGSLVYKMNPIKLICLCGLAGWILF